METGYMFSAGFTTGMIVGVIGYFCVQALCFAASQDKDEEGNHDC